MSSIAVAADSTQSEQLYERRKRRASTERRHRRREVESKKTKKGQRVEQKKAVKRKQSNKESSDDDSDLDFSKELKPIVGYLDDREVMVDHLYRSISASKLRAMLPQIMKPLSTAELRQLCLEQLEVMSKKRIRRILEGDNPDAISSSGTDDSGDDNKENSKGASQAGNSEGSHVADSTNQIAWELKEWSDERNESLGLTKRQSVGSHKSREGEDVESLAEEEEVFREQEEQHNYTCDDHSPVLTLEVQDRSLYEELEDGELPSNDRQRCAGTICYHPAAPPVQPSQRNFPDSETGTIAADSNTLPMAADSEAKLTAASEDQDRVRSDETPPVLSKTQREILELEMRARAIKAMLKAHEERKRRLALENELAHATPQ